MNVHCTKVMKVLSLIFLILILGTPVVDASVYGVSVDIADLQDQRTLEGGLSGYWPAFTISWDITYDSNIGSWDYAYTLSSSAREISHFILELTEGSTADKIRDPSGNFEGPKSWGQGPGNSSPGFPADTSIYGIKFDFGSNLTTYSFSTDLDPVWGNFYAKDGKDGGNDVYVYNDALAMVDFNSNKKLDFIVRPDGSTHPPYGGSASVPSPATFILLISGLLGIAGLRKKLGS